MNLAAFKGGELSEELTQWAGRGLGGFDHRLAAQAYVVDDEFSVADILLATALRQLEGLGVVEKFPHVAAHKQRCEARLAFQRVLDAQEDRLDVPRGAARRSVPERRQMVSAA